MKMTKTEKRDFEALAEEILQDPRYRRLTEFIQHGSVTTYAHCVQVAKMAFVLKRRLHLTCDEKELVTACLLHDYYGYDWHGYGDHLHGLHHPKRAMVKAKQDFNINDRIADAIRCHMWPLTPFDIPNNRSAWLLTASDKICSLHETVLER